MSLILDALNRSQKERDNSREVPGIDTQHWVEPLPPAGRWQRGLPWVGLLIAVLIIAWLLFDSGETKREPTRPETSAYAENTQHTKLQHNSPAKVLPAPLPEDNLAEKNTSKTKSSMAPPSAVDNSAATIGSPDTESVAARGSRNSAVADLYKSAEPKKVLARDVVKPEPHRTDSPPKPAPHTRGTTSAIEEPVDIEKMIAMARRQTKNLDLPEHSVVFLGELSQQIKDQIPTIYYTQHNYSVVADQSMVTLNGESVRVGAKVAGKLKLVEILPGSIILSDRGKEFRLKALNSWINL